MPEMFRREGFTLIETLVATMLLSISLAVMLQLFSGGLRSSHVSRQYTQAVFRASEKMEEILLKPVFTDETLDGEFENGFKWHAQITYLEPEETEENQPKEILDTYQIDVTVLWNEEGKEKQFNLSTLKATPKDESGISQE
jgi:general secretion pathway protein I